jgi:hypothetical protein
MKVGNGRYVGNEVALPVEVIEAIIVSISLVESGRARQRTLWSLCLVSKAWYGVAVTQLYSSPLLGSQNFDDFARTICPAVNSKARAIGLENLVEHLDMGNLAYITSKSKTARLLRRTRTSLLTFIAPSHSMSISALAPISKLSSLRDLDLSRDLYDFNLDQLLNALMWLESLQSLNLPPGIESVVVDGSQGSGRKRWPPSLQRLTINKKIPYHSILSDLPSGMHDLVLKDVSRVPRVDPYDPHAPRSVTSLSINFDWRRVRRYDEQQSWCLGLDFINGFPALEKLSLPAYDFAFEGRKLGSDVVRSDNKIQIITIRAAANEWREMRPEDQSYFTNTFHKFPRLRILYLPNDSPTASQWDFNVFAVELEERWPELAATDKGIHLYEPQADEVFLGGRLQFPG